MKTLDLLIAQSPNSEIQDAFVRHWHKFALGEYQKIMVSVSGGADSDRVIDMIEAIGYPAGTVGYFFFDTGMEYQATRDHLNDLEKKYGIVINRIRCAMPVGKAVRKYGYPFLSKKISDSIQRLQSHNFQWEDASFEDLYKKYPRCKAALRWWCNAWGESSRNNISQRKWLREFMIKNPPQFPISAMCCDKTKKATAHLVEKKYNPDLNVQGLRKAEGGARGQRFNTCFDDVGFGSGCSKLRPIFWFTKDDCKLYDYAFGVTHSKCYSMYGLSRTGCACCPFGRHWQFELDCADQYEPKLAKAARVVFGPSYEYTSAYYSFRDEMNKNKERGLEWRNRTCLINHYV